jgi:hypothetical protein
MFGRVAIVGAFASAAACSLLLQDQSLPCSSDADCLKYSGSRCDLGTQKCVSGDLADSTIGVDSPGSDAPVTPDASEATAPEASPDVDLVDGGAEVSADVAPPIDTGPGPDADAGAPSIDWTALTKYLDSLYDSSRSLVQRAPGSGVFFTSPDNALAQRAFQYLPVPDTTKSAAINARLASYKICGCSDSPGHNALINHQFDPLVHKGWLMPLSPGGPCTGTVTDTSHSVNCTEAPDGSGPPFCGANIQHEDRPGGAADGGSLGWGDTCNPSIGGFLIGGWNNPGLGAGYADLIALEILSYRNQGLFTDTLWSALVGKWDGMGVNDAANASDGFYSTYKLALYKLAALALGKTYPPGIDDKLIAAQGPNGGIRTNYSTTGVFGFPLDQVGSAEVSSLAVLAFRLPTSEL